MEGICKRNGRDAFHICPVHTMSIMEFDCSILLDERNKGGISREEGKLKSQSEHDGSKYSAKFISTLPLKCGGGATLKHAR
mmetsp:Transcript_23614/g.51139  ORF Transcript_23614/g.51139 Transcript_23614/m.51139 type:complete len:81 (-) Transcript_23614:102-344(-)